MNDNPKVSIIIPVYNAEKYLKKCLDSIIGQTLCDIEIICIDDKSTDNSLKILKDYAINDKRIVVIEQNANCGQGIVKNKAIDIARGEYIGFVDPDDYVKPDMYENLYKQAKELHSDIVLSNAFILQDWDNTCWEYEYRYKATTINKTQLVNFPVLENIDKDLLYQTLLVSSCHACNRIYNLTFLKKNKIYFSEERCYEDCIFILKSHILADKISYIPQSYYFYRQHLNSTLSTRKELIFDLLKTINEINEFLTENKLNKIFEDNFRYFCFSNILWLNNKVNSDRYKQYLLLNIKKYLSKYDYECLKKELTTCRQNYSKVSIIIPVYNVQKYLSKCLDSIINQTYTNLEIICINDGSTDNSLDILNEYAEKDNRIKIITKENGGLSSARNKGLDIATGEYCYFVDSDDWIELCTIKTLTDKMMNNNVDCVVHCAKNIAEDNNCIDMAENTQNWLDCKNIPDGVYSVPLDISSKIPSVAWNKLYKMSIIKEFNCRFPEGLINEDEAFIWTYMIHCEKYYNTNACLYNYLRRSDSIMGQRDNSIKILDILKILENIYSTVNTYKNINDYKEILTKRYIQEFYWIYNIMQDKYKAKALKIVKNYYKHYNHDKEIIKLYNSIKYEKLLEIFNIIFSIKNEDIRKAITIFGLKFKFKSKKLIERKRWNDLYDKLNLIEAKLNCFESKLDNNVTRSNNL